MEKTGVNAAVKPAGAECHSSINQRNRIFVIKRHHCDTKSQDHRSVYGGNDSDFNSHGWVAKKIGRTGNETLQVKGSGWSRQEQPIDEDDAWGNRMHLLKEEESSPDGLLQAKANAAGREDAAASTSRDRVSSSQGGGSQYSRVSQIPERNLTVQGTLININTINEKQCILKALLDTGSISFIRPSVY